jgi:hypothetical protein
MLIEQIHDGKLNSIHVDDLNYFQVQIYLGMQLHKFMLNLVGFGLILITSHGSIAQHKTDSLMLRILSGIKNTNAEKILKDPLEYRCQIIYTQIERDKKGAPHFTNYYFNVDPELYFNPASMVKMPLAFLSLEKLNEINLKGVDKYTSMEFDSSYERQVAMKRDSTSQNEKPSISHFIRRAFLISENDPYNRMYQFLGQQSANRKLVKKGYSSTRITRQFMGYTDEQNRHTNGIRFLDDSGKTIYYQQPAYNNDSFSFPASILVGDAHIDRNDQFVKGPFDFTKHNNISLNDMRLMIQAVVFPQSVSAKQRFNISEDDRLFLLKYLSQYPSETSYPFYDSTIFYDSYVKFFFQDSTHQMPTNIRVFNKVGWAYGFLTDVSYVLDRENNIDYMLSATVYVNSDGVVNDSNYDEQTVGFPFLNAIGKAIYKYDLNRNRTYRPNIKIGDISYDKRDATDMRLQIKVADN